MSEYQYYEFQAVDQPLSADQQKSLRALSSRARITGTTFVNHYEWGDFKGNPARLMEDVFDLHLYLASWGSRKFAMRLPRHLVDTDMVEACLVDDEIATWRRAGETIVIEIAHNDMDCADWDDGGGWMAALAPLRSDLLNGDQRLLYLLWLIAVDWGVLTDDAIEPAISLARWSGALGAFMAFFAIDEDLMEAAVGKDAAPTEDGGNARAHALIRALSDSEKDTLLTALFDGSDPHLAAGLRQRVRQQMGRPDERLRRRTAGELRREAVDTRALRLKAEEEKAVEERRQKELEQAKQLQRRLDAHRQRGGWVWRDVDAAIEKRTNPSYDNAAALLAELRLLAQGSDDMANFACRLKDIRQRHGRKSQLLKALAFHGL